jgi:hypothetical protein
MQLRGARVFLAVIRPERAGSSWVEFSHQRCRHIVDLGSLGNRFFDAALAAELLSGG